jgi:hypothetical protein
MCKSRLSGCGSFFEVPFWSRSSGHQNPWRVAIAADQEKSWILALPDGNLFFKLSLFRGHQVGGFL